MANKSALAALRSGIVKSYPGGAVSTRSSFFGMLREPFAGAWQHGLTVNPIGSITANSAVYACIKQIAEDIAKLEPKLKAEDAGIWVDAPNSSPYWRVLRKPNAYQNRIQFLISWLCAKLMHGNAYMLKERADLRGMVTALYPLDPRKVTPMVTPDGAVYYSLSGDDLNRLPHGAIVPASEIIHDRAVTLWHPLVGVPPLFACAMAATQGNRIQANSAKFFENMSRPSGMLTSPTTIDDVTAARLKADWERNYSKENIGRLAIAGDGLKYEAMTIPAEQAQLIEQLDWTSKDIARSFGIPAYKIGAGARPAGDNVEASEIAYYTDCLQILIESIELCLAEGLEMPFSNYPELDLDGLLRMDSAAKITMLTKAAGGAIMKKNEARKKLNLPPATGGDTIYLQHQDYSMEALAKRDARPDPFASGPAAGSLPPPPAPAAAPAAEPPAKAAPIDVAELVGAIRAAGEAASQRLADDGARLVEQLRNATADQQRAADAADRADVQRAVQALPEAIAKALALALPAPVASPLPAAAQEAKADDDLTQAEALVRMLCDGFADLEPVSG